jgi:hypothetical protein
MMGFGLSHKATRTLIASAMLLAFVVRALVPQGFMPASDRTFSVEICPEGFPAQLLAHVGHHHPGTHWHTEHCVFGSACATGPASHVPLLTWLSLTESVPATHVTSAAIVVQLVHLPQTRGPPAA